MGDLIPNDYNPNKMSEDKMEQLKKTLKTTGYLQFIIARPHPEQEGKYLIIDGEHRWKALSELEEFKNDPQNVILVDSDDDVARIQTINFNNLRGEMDNVKIANIINDYLSRHSVEELSAIIGYNEAEIENFQQLVDFDFDKFDSLPGNLSQEDAPPAEILEPVNGKAVAFNMTPEDINTFEKAKIRLPENYDRQDDYACIMGVLRMFVREQEKEEADAPSETPNTVINQ